jgi:hypothetical protein
MPNKLLGEYFYLVNEKRQGLADTLRAVATKRFPPMWFDR